MPDDWSYVQKNQRCGPIPFAKLEAMADRGWLAPDDFVWRAGMGEWIPARDAEGLFANPLGSVLTKTIAGLRRAPEPPNHTSAGTIPQALPNIPAKTRPSTGRKPKRAIPEIDWDRILPRRIVAACGGQVVVINQPPVQRWSPGFAAVLSFFVAGFGQLYKSQIFGAIVWFFLVGVGYLALLLPGLILHFFCVLGALSGSPWTEGKTTVVRQ